MRNHLPCRGKGCQRTGCGCRKSRKRADTQRRNSNGPGAARYVGTITLAESTAVALGAWLAEQRPSPSISLAFSEAMAEFLERRGYLKEGKG